MKQIRYDFAEQKSVLIRPIRVIRVPTGTCVHTVALWEGEQNEI